MQKDTYHRLRKEDRHIIYRMRKAGNTQQQIADILGYSQSTISKELSRNCGQRGYRPKQAHEKSSLRQANKASRSRVISGALEAKVIERLKRKHSPEQISETLFEGERICLVRASTVLPGGDRIGSPYF